LLLPTLDLTDAEQIPDDCEIVFQSENPYDNRNDVRRFNLYNRYKDSTNKPAAMSNGATNATLSEDLKNGYVRIRPYLPGDPRLVVEALKSDDGGIMHAQWLSSRLILIPKKGDLSDPKNCRPIFA